MWRSAAGSASVRDRVVVAVGMVAALALGGCSSSTAPGTGSRALWVANYGGTILDYTATQLASSTSAAPAVVLTTGDTNARIAFDASGNLWVTEPTHNAVVEYTANQQTASGSRAPNVTLTANAAGSLHGPVGLAFDASGNLWVANVAGTVVKFTTSQILASGSPTPVVTLSGNFESIDAPLGLAFDHGGNLWMTGFFSDALIEFTASQLASSGFRVPAVTLSDTSNGYPPGQVTLALDGGGNLWVANANSNTVVEFASSQLGSSGIPTPAVTLRSINTPQALAFDGHGNLWVSNGATTVVEFAASQLMASGAPTPTVTLSGPALVAPVALAFTP